MSGLGGGTNRLQDLPVPDLDPEEVRSRADAIMARAEFSNSESILDRAGRWLNEAFGGLFDALSGGGAGSIVAWGIFAALIAAVVVLVVRLQPRALRSMSAGVGTRSADHADREQRSAAQWRAEADRLTALGIYDEALRARYRALLADLVAAGRLDDVAGRTPGEYRRELATSAPPSAERFSAATDQFEEVWYGAQPVSADDLAQFIQTEHAILVQVGR